MRSDIDQTMIDTAVEALKDKLGYDIKVLDVSQATSICDSFVIVSGSNKSQLNALVDSVEEMMLKKGYDLKGREGRSESGWVLLDYNELVIHIFSDEMRDFYNLESTWRDVPSEDR